MADSKNQDDAEKSDQQSAVTLPATTELERELAQQATQEFDQANYDACLTTISRLAEIRGHDLKVIHNQAVAAFYKSGLTKGDEFTQALDDLHAKVSVDEIAALDDIDQCNIYYNNAVVLFYTKQYNAAFAVLSKVMQLIEQMDENTSRKVAFLMVELYLNTYQPTFHVKPPDYKTEQASALCIHLSLVPYKALQLLAFIDKTQSSKSSSPDKERDDTDLRSSTEQLADTWKAVISQYKVRCFLMLKSVKSCKREIKSLTSSSSSAVPVTFLKSQLEYVRGNYQKAIRMLSNVATQVLPPTPQSSPLFKHNAAAMYYNNLGILHFHMRKHNLGLFYFRRALQENARACSKDSAQSSPLNELGLSRHYELMFNIGVQLLHCGQPQLAFDCLLETVQQFQINPYLWLRLAECCIMVHRPNNDVDRSHSKKMDVVCGTVGSGVHHKLILGSGVRVEKTSSVLESSAIPLASMEFAALCLDNALILLPEGATVTSSQGSSSEPEQKSPTDPVLQPAMPGNPLRVEDLASLRCSVLACRAYVALYHNDYVVALQSAQKLLRQPRLSGAHKYLGHMYMAEALVALDRIADSIDHLNADLISDVSTVFPVDQRDPDKSEKNGDSETCDQTEFKGAKYPWSPANVAQAKAIMTYNLATTHTIRGEHDKALQHLSKATQPLGQPLPAQVYYLKIYLELMEGRRSVLQNLFRENFGHVAANR